ncbi:MAG: glycosyltransferase family 4 protein [Deltaproteobacteria bacterium]|nr:glycosyltransferase family 4 protein [Deltaproteobacteria bacterium]
MITVIHVITKLELGGAQENTLYTCGHLDRTQFTVALAYGPGGHLDEEANQLPCTTTMPVPHLVRELSPANDARCLMSLVKRFRATQRTHCAQGHDPSHVIVHTHSSKAGILGRVAARVAQVPHVVHTIHGFGFFSGQHPIKHAFFVEAERAVGRSTDAFICVSKANLAEARARRIIGPSQEVRVIRSGMPLSLYRGLDERRSGARTRLGIEPDHEVILFIGNFKPQKDPLTLIQAMHHVAARRPHTTLLMAGDGELRPAVETEIRRLGLEPHVRLLGWREDVPELLAAADVVALSSLFEGLPRSAIQAIAAGRPFVGTRVDGTTEIIRHGKNGFLVEPRAPAKLGNALIEALVQRPVDPDDAQRIQAWDADKMVEAQADLYRDLVRQDQTTRVSAPHPG